jgi:hypothetical protein
MLDRRTLLTATAATALAAALPAQAAPSRETVLATMRRATAFMTDKVANRGGYVWSYLPDFSRRWGEMEAFPTQIWVQPPGTATMGHLFLDAFHATGDEAYYRAAENAAQALVDGQNPSGGWNYLIDFAGEASTRKWYDTIGRNGWRLEEFQHYYGNATFDDAGTSESAQFLLRMHVEKGDQRWRPALNKAIDFVLASQYPNGGWPQRFPLKDEFHHHGLPDYTSLITFNDDVAAENIKFLLMCLQALGEERVVDPIHRAMDCFILCQQPQPQPAWGLQHTVADLKPAGARTYEPKAFVTHTTAANIAQMMTFYELTGDDRYLARLPEAMDWLAAVKLPTEQAHDGKAWPTFIEIGTNQPLYIHRRGSNVVNGEYWADRDPAKTLVHYSSFRKIDLDGLRKRYADLKARPVAEVTAKSPLKVRGQPLPRYFSLGEVSVSDLNVNAIGAKGAVTDDQVAALGARLNAEGWWPTPLLATSHPYSGDGSPTPAPGDFSQTRVGDATDTSPYIDPDPKIGISTGAYIENMIAMIRWLGAS